MSYRSRHTRNGWRKAKDSRTAHKKWARNAWSEADTRRNPSITGLIAGLAALPRQKDTLTLTEWHALPSWNDIVERANQSLGVGSIPTG
jgi:hypothetical protein